MTLVAPFNFVLIDLTEKEQKDLKELVTQQLQDLTKGIGHKGESKKICNVMWKQLKHIVMKDEINTKQLVIPLNEHDQILIKRYIDAERQQPDFIAKGLSKNFLLEVFLYFYYAGHGCSDLEQYIVLNEKELERIFWSAEANIK